MKKRPSTKTTVLTTLGILGLVVGFFVYRGLRLGYTVYGFASNLRYQLESGESIAETPAGEALAVSYLETIFGDNQELLGRLKGVVKEGMEDTASLNLGTVSAMLVTYHRDDKGEVKDVVAHVMGGFPLGKRKPGFHRDGYFRHLIDKNLWNMGNAAMALLGRDMIIFAEEQVAERHQAMLEALLVRGDVLPLAESLHDPMYFTAVFPDPKRLLPLQLRHHIQALIVKGMLSPNQGNLEFVLLTPSSRSAAYVLSIASDLQVVAETALKTKWHGVAETKPWDDHVVDTWWAYEMVQTSEKMSFEKQHNIVRAKTELDRVMVNAFLKSVERMGRDLAQSSGTMDDRLDPRLVDLRLSSDKPQHYWSRDHRWGPDWPFRGATNAVNAAEAPPTAVPSEATTTPEAKAPAAPPAVEEASL